MVVRMVVRALKVFALIQVQLERFPQNRPAAMRNMWCLAALNLVGYAYGQDQLDARGGVLHCDATKCRSAAIGGGHDCFAACHSDP